ncbi:MAG: PCP reductase family protein [Gemmatimonadota bacterium]|nr:PCP reductase family protein [Gemmatimonadota bacterium]
MKFLCIDCDEVMAFAERRIPGDGTMAAVFACPSCEREMAMLTNPAETSMVSGLGIKVGGREVPGQPMELVRTTLETGGAGALEDVEDRPGAGTPDGEPTVGPSPEETRPLTAGTVAWSEDAKERLQLVPAFVRGMVKKIYGEWAADHGIEEITPAVMDRARSELGLEGM